MKNFNLKILAGWLKAAAPSVPPFWPAGRLVAPGRNTDLENMFGLAWDSPGDIQGPGASLGHRVLGLRP